MKIPIVGIPATGVNQGKAAGIHILFNDYAQHYCNNCYMYVLIFTL